MVRFSKSNERNEYSYIELAICFLFLEESLYPCDYQSGTGLFSRKQLCPRNLQCF